jgi:diguanylate cyclase (GGDEF)-like protein
MPRLGWVAAAGWWCASAFATAAPLALAPDEPGGRALGRHAEVLEDAGRRLTVGDLVRPENARRFVSSDANELNFGYTASTYWLRFSLRGARGAEDLLLELRFPSIDEADLYAPEPPGDGEAGYRITRGGDSQRFHARGFKHRNHVFRIHVPEGEERTFFLRLRSDGVLTAPLYLWREAAFAEGDRHVQLALGVFYGLVMALVLYNLMLYLAVRDRVYLYYVMYGVAFGMFLLCFDGYAYEYLWPESVWWANHALATALSLTLAFGALFARSFLDMPRRAPRAAGLLGAASAAGAALAVASATGWVLSYGAVLRTLSVLGFATAAGTLYVAVAQWLRGERSARYFLLAWAVLLVFIAVGALRNFALVPTNFLTVHGLHFGLGLDLLLLSFALADRIAAMKREKDGAQADSLAAHRALLEATRENERMLESRIRERTAELNRANERLRDEVREREQLMEQLKEREQHLRFMAQHDPLTGLPNRHSMQQRLALALELAKRNRKKLAVMLVDLDGFKSINDTRGHVAGDAALVAIAARLRTSVRGSDTVARYGGDEFVVLAGELDRAEDAGTIAEKISDMVSVPLPLEGGMANISCSIGISVFPDHAEQAERLIELADKAMYASKSRAGQRFAYYTT